VVWSCFAACGPTAPELQSIAGVNASSASLQAAGGCMCEVDRPPQLAACSARWVRLVGRRGSVLGCAACQQHMHLRHALRVVPSLIRFAHPQASSLYMAFVFQKVDQPDQACAPEPEQQQQRLKRRRDEEQEQAPSVPPGRRRDDRHEGQAPPAHLQQAAPHHRQQRPYPPQQPPPAAGSGYHPPGPMHAAPGGYGPPPTAPHVWPAQVRRWMCDPGAGLQAANNSHACQVPAQLTSSVNGCNKPSTVLVTEHVAGVCLIRIHQLDSQQLQHTDCVCLAITLHAGLCSNGGGRRTC
jgi:hypothetical protein